MICPYGYDVGELARRGSCALKVSPAADAAPVEQCPCDREMAQLSGSLIDDAPIVTDPQSAAVIDYWVAAEEAERQLGAIEWRAIRPTL